MLIHAFHFDIKVFKFLKTKETLYKIRLVKVDLYHFPDWNLSKTKFWYNLSSHTVQCGNFGNLLSRIFDKNFVKATFLLKNWFHGKKFWRENFVFSTLWCGNNGILPPHKPQFRRKYSVNCTAVWKFSP